MQVAGVSLAVREVLKRWQHSTSLALHGVSCLEEELAHQLLTIRKQNQQLQQRVRCVALRVLPAGGAAHA